MFTRFPTSHLTRLRRFLTVVKLPVAVVCCLVFLAGCGRFRHQQHETVYVSIRETYIHDRVAPVSNRVCQVRNAQPLEVLERGKRFLKVKTGNNEIGWIEEHAVIDARTYDGFVQLAQQHKDDPAAVSATLRDDLAMHLLPGRETERFYLLPGDSKVQLLARASAPKKPSEAYGPLPNTGAAKPAENGKSAPVAPPIKPGTPKQASLASAQETEPPEMEDWWLARDAQGRVGWLLGSRLDVDVPQEVAQYGEEQRFIGCWMLTKVTDPGTDTPNHQVGEYLTVLAPLKSGLPFDFDDVRVFTWSLKHHRYETAFRLHPIRGFLPVRISSRSTATGSAPAFGFQLAASNDVTTDPATGITRPAAPRTIDYEMIDTRVQRIGPDLAPIQTIHEPGEKKPAKAPKKTKHR